MPDFSKMMNWNAGSQYVSNVSIISSDGTRFFGSKFFGKEDIWLLNLWTIARCTACLKAGETTFLRMLLFGWLLALSPADSFSISPPPCGMVEWFPNEVYYLQHLFFCWDSVGLESSGLLSSQRRKRRVLILQHLFCEMCSCMRTFWTVGWRNIAIDLVLYLVRKSCRTVFLYREMSTWELEYSFSISQNQITIMCNAREASVALASGASGSVLH